MMMRIARSANTLRLGSLCLVKRIFMALGLRKRNTTQDLDALLEERLSVMRSQSKKALRRSETKSQKQSINISIKSENKGESEPGKKRTRVGLELSKGDIVPECVTMQQIVDLTLRNEAIIGLEAIGEQKNPLLIFWGEC